MMAAAQIARLGEYGQGIDWPDAGNGAQQLIIGPIAQQFDRPVFDGVALPDQLRPSASIMRNMRMASEFGDTGTPADTFAVS